MDVGVCEMQDEEAGEAAASAAIPPGLLKHPSLPLIQPESLHVPSPNSLRFLPLPPRILGLPFAGTLAAGNDIRVSSSPYVRTRASPVPLTTVSSTAGAGPGVARFDPKSGKDSRGTGRAARLPAAPSRVALREPRESRENRDGPVAMEAVRRVRRSSRNSSAKLHNSSNSEDASSNGSGRAAQITCVKCGANGKRRGGKSCGSCQRWWHSRCAESSGGCAEVSGCPGAGDWVGGFRCLKCLWKWEIGLKERTTAVRAAWAQHEDRREENASHYHEAAAAALRMAKENKKSGFLVQDVKVQPIPYPPAGVLPFLDLDAIKENGYRLAIFTREDCAFMGPIGVLRKVELCWKDRIFAVIKGAFDGQQQPLMDFLGQRKGLPCKISGKESTGESSSTMGDYMQKLEVFDGSEKPSNENPGTFFLDSVTGQAESLEWLEQDPFMRHFIPESPRGGLREHRGGDRCKFGPFTFGGGRNYPLMAPGERNASRTSVRQFLQGRKRERIGGSTTHMDGMGSFTAVGGVKAGEKSVTAFETADCGTALAIAKFKSYAKPGGSDFVVNARIDDDLTLRERLNAAGVRYRTFPILEGDGYLVPSGTLHEFMNVVPCLSVAWNIMPHPLNCKVAMRMAFASAEEALVELGSRTDRSQCAIEYAPPESMELREIFYKCRGHLERRILLKRRHSEKEEAAALREAFAQEATERFFFNRPTHHYYPGVPEKKRSSSMHPSPIPAPVPPVPPVPSCVSRERVPSTPCVPPQKLPSTLDFGQSHYARQSSTVSQLLPTVHSPCSSIAPLGMGIASGRRAIEMLPPPPKLSQHPPPESSLPCLPKASQPLPSAGQTDPGDVDWIDVGNDEVCADFHSRSSPAGKMLTRPHGNTCVGGATDASSNPMTTSVPSNVPVAAARSRLPTATGQPPRGVMVGSGGEAISLSVDFPKHSEDDIQVKIDDDHELDDGNGLERVSSGSSPDGCTIMQAGDSSFTSSGGVEIQEGAQELQDIAVAFEEERAISAVVDVGSLTRVGAPTGTPIRVCKPGDTGVVVDPPATTNDHYEQKGISGPGSITSSTNGDGNRADVIAVAFRSPSGDGIDEERETVNAQTGVGFGRAGSPSIGENRSDCRKGEDARHLGSDVARAKGTGTPKGPCFPGQTSKPLDNDSYSSKGPAVATDTARVSKVAGEGGGSVKRDAKVEERQPPKAESVGKREEPVATSNGGPTIVKRSNDYVIPKKIVPDTPGRSPVGRKFSDYNRNGRVANPGPRNIDIDGTAVENIARDKESRAFFGQTEGRVPEMQAGRASHVKHCISGPSERTQQQPTMEVKCEKLRTNADGDSHAVLGCSGRRVEDREVTPACSSFETERGSDRRVRNARLDYDRRSRLGDWRRTSGGGARRDPFSRDSTSYYGGSRPRYREETRSGRMRRNSRDKSRSASCSRGRSGDDNRHRRGEERESRRRPSAAGERSRFCDGDRLGARDSSCSSSLSSGSSERCWSSDSRGRREEICHRRSRLQMARDEGGSGGGGQSLNHAASGRGNGTSGGNRYRDDRARRGRQRSPERRISLWRGHVKDERDLSLSPKDLGRSDYTIESARRRDDHYSRRRFSRDDELRNGTRRYNRERSSSGSRYQTGDQGSCSSRERSDSWDDCDAAVRSVTRRKFREHEVSGNSGGRRDSQNTTTGAHRGQDRHDNESARWRDRHRDASNGERLGARGNDISVCRGSKNREKIYSSDEDPHRDDDHRQRRSGKSREQSRYGGSRNGRRGRSRSSSDSRDRGRRQQDRHHGHRDQHVSRCFTNHRRDGRDNSPYSARAHEKQERGGDHLDYSQVKTRLAKKHHQGNLPIKKRPRSREGGHSHRYGRGASHGTTGAETSSKHADRVPPPPPPAPRHEATHDSKPDTPANTVGSRGKELNTSRVPHALASKRDDKGGDHARFPLVWSSGNSSTANVKFRWTNGSGNHAGLEHGDRAKSNRERGSDLQAPDSRTQHLTQATPSACAAGTGIGPSVTNSAFQEKRAGKGLSYASRRLLSTNGAACGVSTESHGVGETRAEVTYEWRLLSDDSAVDTAPPSDQRHKRESVEITSNGERWNGSPKRPKVEGSTIGTSGSSGITHEPARRRSKGQADVSSRGSAGHGASRAVREHASTASNHLRNSSAPGSNANSGSTVLRKSEGQCEESISPHKRPAEFDSDGQRLNKFPRCKTTFVADEFRAREGEGSHSSSDGDQATTIWGESRAVNSDASKESNSAERNQGERAIDSATSQSAPVTMMGGVMRLTGSWSRSSREAGDVTLAHQIQADSSSSDEYFAHASSSGTSGDYACGISQSIAFHPSLVGMASLAVAARRLQQEQ